MPTIPIDRLYAIIDAEVANDPSALAQRAIRAGVALLQLRAKRLPDVEFLTLADVLANECAKASVPFIVNDRPDIANLVGAAGVHLGQDDMPIDDARAVVGTMEIGISTHDLDQARAADQAGADRIAFGPVFETPTKRNPDPVVGLEALARVCETVRQPVVAIGGITPENAREVIRAGAHHVAVISALPRFLAPFDAP